ncbi:leucine-rich repeat domain-containing protein [Streptomyces sp. H27-S2]|uniref:leucine-rich repeat domain-containing protein n=1 Tax=Streptomyces antarcticus TaxID=2996458 RepID=UPI0022711689|nr:leucine-rich repeat domain-containing protein [Streptomyces sp. H27-S2]MCY0948735.1 leucine-rich repeat domain-containing protein [Streptomyces sp. H27-S2]
MDATPPEPRLFANRWPEGIGPDGRPIHRERCTCFNQYKAQPRARVGFHGEHQDTSSAGWLRLLSLVEEAAADGREEFNPLVELSPHERRDVITLPASIARLTEVKHLRLYGSNLVRIPPEIGAMTNLEEFSPYTSHRLHWFPYEITRCSKLANSTVSTRSLFGNFKLRPPFPRLRKTSEVQSGDRLAALDPKQWGTTAISTCSVCDGPVEGRELHQRWISLVVATDVLPLLVNACSTACVAALPPGAAKHAPQPHLGGWETVQPSADWA